MFHRTAGQKAMRVKMDAVRIQEADFSQEEEVAAIRTVSSCIGGVVTFLGCARDFSEGRAVQSIQFEHYADMALNEMKALHDEAIEAFDIIAVRMIHRVTTVQAGEQIVLIIVASEHRKAAFEACEWLIDSL
ncbi:MAG: molybdenum cofactor biosynthesis protein MoaE, partial [Mariprofundaceae bacterium]|nr:molybdenum cofactor biosynthesis protein MoaE [Mariprofundaceae bacterium]